MKKQNDTGVTWHFKKSLGEVLFTLSSLHLNLRVREDLLPCNFQDVTVAMSEQSVSGTHFMPKFSVSPGDDYFRRYQRQLQLESLSHISHNALLKQSSTIFLVYTTNKFAKLLVTTLSSSKTAGELKNLQGISFQITYWENTI